MSMFHCAGCKCHTAVIEELSARVQVQTWRSEAAALAESLRYRMSHLETAVESIRRKLWTLSHANRLPK